MHIRLNPIHTSVGLLILVVHGAGLAAPPAKKELSPIGQASRSLSPYAQRILSLQPIGYWRLGESKGPTASDSSGHKHDGVYHGFPEFHSLGAVPHDPDRAIGLSGKAYVEIPSSSEFHVKRGLTVEAWIRPDRLDFPGETKDPYIHWMGKGEKNHFEWGFRFYSKKRADGTASSRPNRISAYIWNANGAEGAGAYFQEPVIPGEWIHVVAVYEPPGKGAGARIYRNGVFKKGPPDKGTLYSSYHILATPGPAALRLGTRDLHSFFSGGLDEVAIYPRVLSPQEIKANYLSGTRAERL